MWYYKDGGDEAWSTVGDWWANIDGTGAHPAAAPWTTAATADDDLSLVTGETTAPQLVAVAIGDGFAITGVCDIDGVVLAGDVYSGTFTGDDIEASGPVYNGLFSGDNLLLSGIVNGGIFSGGDTVNVGLIHGGIFLGAGLTNNGDIYGGFFFGADFVNSGDICGGTFSTTGTSIYGGTVYGGFWFGSGRLILNGDTYASNGGDNPSEIFGTFRSGGGVGVIGG